MNLVSKPVIYIMAAVIALMSLALGYQTVRVYKSRAKEAITASQFAKYKELAETSARVETEKNRAIDRQRFLDQRKSIEQAQAETAALLADNKRLDDSLKRMLNRYAAVTASKPASRPAAVTGGATTEPATTVPTDVPGRLGEAAGQLAIYAQQARIAGQACEREYKSIEGSSNDSTVGRTGVGRRP